MYGKLYEWKSVLSGHDVSDYACIWRLAHSPWSDGSSCLAMYALYIGIFISPIQILVELTEMMQKGLSGFRRFLDVVETEPEITNAPDAELLDEVKGDVNYENVFFHYSDDDTRFWKMYRSIFRLENQLRWLVLLEVARQQFVPCFQDFTM